MVCLYLVWVDIKDEPDLEFQIKIWWFLLVLLLHVPGYLIFRLWIWRPGGADVVQSGPA